MTTESSSPAAGRLKNRIALVTGAARNVGKGIAHCLAREGAEVVMVDINEASLMTTTEDMRANGLRAHPLVADISQPEAIERLFTEIKNRYDTLAILVNNAIINADQGERGPFLKVTYEGWHAFTTMNLDSLFLLTQKAAVIMSEKKCGCIVSISSNGAIQSHRQRIAYDTVKGALESFTRAVAIDLAPWGIRVNAVRVCVVADQERVEKKPEFFDRLGAMIPLGRIASPEDVGWATVFLADDRAGFVTGQIINVDGGMLEQSRPPSLELEPVVTPDNI